MDATEALTVVSKYVQWMRENGENDLRGLLYMIADLKRDIIAGKNYEQVVLDLFEEASE